jgi:hypothetical protein
MATKKKTENKAIKKNLYTISVPITGRVVVDVEASSEEEALEKLWERDEPWPQPDEWEVCETIVTGNVFNGMQNETSIEHVDHAE